MGRFLGDSATAFTKAALHQCSQYI
ncbi:hypothetical protein E2C01_052287 [Portunus trituberculatus]|uniref:Uncharacterized protein n=1 Tax=Portunus trituberculatus TaxID=210409 RepID=A0A5B7GE12_PORTR|nr:hypothetical protein [Portunus trituberculatus]